MLVLSISERKTLRARAHDLNPVVIISQKGLTDTVLAEIDKSLNAHELIKIRVAEGDRVLREAFLTQICDALKAAPVWHIGKLLVVYRPLSQEKAAAKKSKSALKKPRYKRDFQ